LNDGGFVRARNIYTSLGALVSKFMSSGVVDKPVTSGALSRPFSTTSMYGAWLAQQKHIAQQSLESKLPISHSVAESEIPPQIKPFTIIPFNVSLSMDWLHGFPSLSSVKSLYCLTDGFPFILSFQSSVKDAEGEVSQCFKQIKEEFNVDVFIVTPEIIEPGMAKSSKIKFEANLISDPKLEVAKALGLIKKDGSAYHAFLVVNSCGEIVKSFYVKQNAAAQIRAAYQFLQESVVIEQAIEKSVSARPGK
jgi:hypothetical protein